MRRECSANEIAVEKAGDRDVGANFDREMVSNDVGPYCWSYVLIRLVGRFAGGALQHALAFFDAMRSGDVSAPPVRPATPARFGY